MSGYIARYIGRNIIAGQTDVMCVLIYNTYLHKGVCAFAILLIIYYFS